MTIRELWISLNRVTRDVSSWVYSPFPKLFRIGQNGIDKVFDINFLSKNNHDNSHDSSNINSNNTEETQILETSSSSNRPETRNNYNHINNGNLIASGVNGNSRKYSSSFYSSHFLQEHKEDLTPLHPKENLPGRLKYVVEELTKEGNKKAKCRYYEYTGRIEESKQLVKIKEYVFINSLLQKNQSEFIERANIKLKLQADFRLITPSDTFRVKNKNRCYIITQLNKNYITLREYLNRKGSMSDREVNNLLEQVLQSLHCLHSQNIMLGNQIERGLAHGNINIDSLLIEDRGGKFFVYLTDFAIWEDIFIYQEFIETNSYINDNKFKDDLKDLGDVALQALCWNGVEQSILNSNDSKEVQELLYKRNTQGVIEFILNYTNRQFYTNKPEDKQELPKKSSNDDSDKHTSEQNEEIQEESDFHFASCLLVSLLITCLFGGSFAVFSNISQRVNSDDEAQLEQDNNDNYTLINQVSLNGIDEIKYYAKDNGVWDYLLNIPNIVAYRKTFLEEINHRLGVNENNFFTKADELQTNENIIKEINEGDIDFALLTKKQELDSDSLVEKVIAYDALVVIVPYSDGKGKGTWSVPSAMNSKIIIDDLRYLYTQNKDLIEEWQSRNNNNRLQELNGKKIKLYFQDIYKEDSIDFNKSEIVNIFEEKVLKEPKRIAAFSNLGKEILNREEKYLLKSQYIFRNIIDDFETSQNQTIGIGVSLLSRVYGQCSVYPLAIKENNYTFYPLIQNDNNPIKENTDLCYDKGSYKPNTNVFHNEEDKYPLKFPLVIVYKKGSESAEKFIEIMQTDEGKDLLKEAGFTPTNSKKNHDQETSNKSKNTKDFIR